MHVISVTIGYILGMCTHRPNKFVAESVPGYLTILEQYLGSHTLRTRAQHTIAYARWSLISEQDRRRGLPVTVTVAKRLRCEAALDMSQSGDLSDCGQMQETRPSGHSRRMKNR